MVRQYLHGSPDRVAHASRFHHHAVHSKRVVFRGGDDQFCHQEQRHAVRQWEPWSWTVQGNLIMDDDCKTVIDRCSSRRRVPLRPDVVRHLLKTEKKFTSDVEKGVVAGLYERFFNDVASSCPLLSLSGLDWTDQEIRELAGSLPFSKKLGVLILSGNKISDEGAVALAGALKGSQASQESPFAK